MLKRLERGLLAAGFMAMGVFVYAYGESRLQANQGLQDFFEVKTLMADRPDMSLWSPERIEAYQASEQEAVALGVLRIDRLLIEAPIFNGATDAILDRGIGWIEGTSPVPDTKGNTALAAHRDGFFRGLKDVSIGDEITVETLNGIQHYRITGTDVVAPEETYVLERTHTATLTLVTCYPFYFVGSAPERFVVFATLFEKSANNITEEDKGY